MGDADYQDAIGYCLERSWCLRRLQPRSRWLIRHAVANREINGSLPEELDLCSYLRSRVKGVEGIGFVQRWVLRWIAAPLIAELVWRWSVEHKLDTEKSTWSP